MMENNTLRKTDLFSGALIVLLGLFIIGQAFQMPMKDSWGGVQNVWFVSPALFPLFVGVILSLLGLALIRIALKAVGLEGVKETFRYLFSDTFVNYLKSPLSIRFIAVVLQLVIFVFLLIPRIDFFPAAIYFLLILFFMFYLCNHSGLVKLLFFSIIASGTLCCLLFTPLGKPLFLVSEFAGDWYMLLIIICLSVYGRVLTGKEDGFSRRYRLSITIAVLAPLIVGVIFKYFLLVPMPFEGLVVQLLDSIWYADIWS